MPDKKILELVKQGIVIPPLSLALKGRKNIDEKYQRALIRYYCAAGAGGIAVGVHTTQFEIRNPGINLYEPLLKFTCEAIRDEERKYQRPIVKIAGVCGDTNQATREAEVAVSLGYDSALLSLSALKTAPDDRLIRHCRAVSRIIPLFGFYLQPAVGGRVLPYSFWRRFVEIDNVIGIKIAPFNRYQTLDVARAVAMAGREQEVTLYTGNDDNIIMDLITPFPVHTSEGRKCLRIRGGLLGQWSVWTKKGVELLEEIHGLIDQGADIPLHLLARHAALTDANSAIFDAAHDFAGCIPGIHEVLRRQGLLRNIRCLDPRARLSPGQAEEMDRILRDYPFLTDDEFVQQHRSEWLEA